MDIVGTNNGVLQGGATASSAGMVGSAFSFDGTNSFVAISNSPTLRPANFTIEAWVRFSGLDSLGSGGSPAGDQYVIFKQNTRSSDFEGIDLSKTRVGSTDVFRFLVTSAADVSAEIHSSTVIATGVWYHVAVVRGTNFTQIFVNGQLQGQSNNVTFAQDYGTLPLYFGTSGQSFWDHKFKGSLDEVSIYSRPLSSNEISAIYTAGASGKCKAVNITAQPQGQTNVAIGSTVSFTVAATGVNPFSYQWRFNGTNIVGATGTSLSVTNVQVANGGSYTVVLTNTLSAATSTVAVLTVGIPPSISGPPQSQTNVVGSNATFSVVASGSPAPGFQWRFNGANLNNATSSSLTLSGIQTSDQGGYSVVASNIAGSVTSAVATLTVWVPPSISLQPQSQTNIIGSNAVFTASASATPAPGYQWQFNGGAILGATVSVLPLSGIQPSNAGNYTVVASNGAGSITSAVATLTVWIPPTVSLQPQSQTNITGSNVAFTASAAGTPAPGYQWQFNGGPIAGATGPTLSLTGIQPSDAGSYSVIASNGAGSVSSAVATLTVWVPPSISLQPQSQTNIIGSNAVFTASASATPAPGYQWQFNGGAILGATASVLPLSGIQPSNEGNYTVVASNAAGSITSSVAVLTVWVPPLIALQPLSQTNLIGSTITFTASASGAPAPAYQWQFNGGSIPGSTGSVLQFGSIQPSDAGSYTVVASNAAGSVTSSVATLTVWVPPSIALQPQSQTNIIGSNAVFTAAASGTPAPGYQWQFNGNPIPGKNGAVLFLANAQPSDGGSYTVVASSAAGSITSAVATLTIWIPPSISAQPQSQTNLIGSDLTFSVSASGAPDVAYQWQFNGSPMAGQTGALLFFPSIQPSNAGNYSVVVSNAAGSLTSSVAALTVWVPPSISSQPQSLTNITGSVATFSVAAAGTPSVAYQWQFNGTNLSNGTGSSYTIAPVQLSHAGTYSVILTNSAGTVTSAPATLLVIEGVGFCDVNLEDAIRAQLGKPAGLITTLDMQSLKTLIVPDSHIAGLCGLERASNLATLYLGNNVISDISVFTNLFRLTNLFLYNNLLTNLTPLASLTNLSFLDLRNNPTIGTFSPLSGLTNLNILRLGGNGLTNVSAVQSLRRLSFLGLNNNAISDFSPLVTMTNLSGLDVSYNASINSQQISGVPSLRNLYLSGLGLTNVGFLQSLTGLTNLCLHANSLVDVSPVALLTGLKSLDLSANLNVSAFSPLSTLTNLQTLWMHDNLLSSLSFVQPLIGLTYLNLHDNLVSDLSPLAGLTRLTGLNLETNLLGGTAPLSGLTNLLNLALGANSITNLVLPQAPWGLISLSVFSNLLSAAPSLGAFTNLSTLDLGGNPLTNSSTVSVCTNLSSLGLYGNALNDISFLAPLGRLSVLDLHSNAIASVSPLAGLSNLSALNLSGNVITDVSSLGGIPKLASLDLSFNPLAGFNLAGTNLSALALRGNGFTNLGFVQNLPYLSSLDITRNRFANPAPLSTLTNLHSVFAGYNSLSDISNLTGLQRLWNVDVRTNLLDLTAAGQILTIQTLSNRLVAIDFAPQNQLPTITLPGYLAISANTTSAPISFAVSDDVTPVPQLITNITAVSLNPALIPNAGVFVGATNGAPFLRLAPVAGQTGLAQILVTVTDETMLSTNAFISVQVVSPQTVAIPDPKLVSAIRAALNKPTGALNNVDLLNLFQLAGDSAGITNLTGLEWSTNLTSLSMNNNAIQTLQPIQDLRLLSSLSLDYNPILSFSPLSGLTNLLQLSVAGNSISNVVFAQTLTRLWALVLSNNRLTDISPIAGLPALSSLLLDQNLLTNLVALPQPASLSFLNLAYNLLDVSPGSPPRQVITNLQARGVVVSYLPQRSPPMLFAPARWLISQATPSVLSLTLSESVPPSPPYTNTASSSNSTLLPGTGLQILQDPVLGLILSVVPASNQSGTASVGLTAKDATGLSTTTSVLVTVSTQPLGLQLFGRTNLTWSSFGDALWFGQTAVTHSGLSAAQSGDINDNQESWLRTTVVGPGRLSFWWRVSSEPDFDFLEFYINGVVQPGRISGTNGGWRQLVYFFNQGTNVLGWCYEKDQNTSMGADAGWLDEVTFSPGPWLEIAPGSSGSQRQLVLHGIPGRPYQVQISTNLVNWTPGNVVTPTNNSMIFIDTGATNRTQFYRVQDLQSSIWLTPPTKVPGGIQLVLHSAPGLRFDIQASTNLQNWNSIGTVTNVSGSTQITDATATNRQMRMYRASLML